MATNISLIKGQTLTIEGTRNQNEFAAIDYLQLVPVVPPVLPPPSSSPLWSDTFAGDWQNRWRTSTDHTAWGQNNLQVISTGENTSDVLRVIYPKGSVSPSLAKSKGIPVGGAQFLSTMGIAPQTSLRLSYSLRFSDNFNFVKGGKLPGLYGGNAPSGGKIPNGTDGFSTRFMWRSGGQGEVYAYLPTSRTDGTSIGQGAWSFKPGIWHQLEQEVVLNTPGQDNGFVRVWLDGSQVWQETGIRFRTADSLKIDGIFFSTFFGGGDSSWATPADVSIDFANFSLSTPEPFSQPLLE